MIVMSRNERRTGQSLWAQLDVLAKEHVELDATMDTLRKERRILLGKELELRVERPKRQDLWAQLDLLAKERDLDEENSKEKGILQASRWEDAAHNLGHELERGKERSAELMSTFFEALDARCDHKEEKDELQLLVARRQRKERRWATKADPNSLAFPVLKPGFDPMQPPLRLWRLCLWFCRVSAEALAAGTWWKDSSSIQAYDANAETFSSLRTFKVVGEGKAATAEEVSVDPIDLRREMVEDTSGAYDPTVPAEGAWVGRPAPEAMSDEEKSYCANFSDLLCKEKSLLPGLVHDIGEGRLAAWESVSSDKLFAEDIVTEKQAALIEFRARRGPVSEHQRKARVAKLSRYFQNYEGRSFEFLPRRRDKSLVSPPGPEFFAESIKVLSTPEDDPMVVARHRKADEDHHDRLAQFGSRFTTLNGDFTWPGTFAFKSALAKAKMDERMAALESSDGRARRLLDKGAEVDRANDGGGTPLFVACQEGRADAARLLLDNGAEVDRATEDGATPLYIACEKGRADAARLLLGNGAKVNMAEKDGRTLLDIAKSQGHSSIVALLEEGGN